MLVGATVALFVILVTEMIRSFEPQDIVTVDPVRVVETIVRIKANQHDNHSK